MRTDELDFSLPDDLIAAQPASARDASRLMVVSRTDPERVEHAAFRDLPGFLGAGDLLVRNRSKVVPARLVGRRADAGGRIEGLFLRERSAGEWEIMLKSNGRLRPGVGVVIEGRTGEARLDLLERTGDGWLVRVASPGDGPAALLDRIGRPPLPPYIRRAREHAGLAAELPEDDERYQTVYADAWGSVAAPTAGLHFTPGVDRGLAARGVRDAHVVLHVGAGTFRPIDAERLEDHEMHAEWVDVPASTADAAARTRAAGGRVIAVGTTTCRALESAATDGPIDAWSGWTTLMIAPGRPFRAIDALITNFHLPRSTLLALVGAMFPGGVPRVLELYRAAVEARYRFYSYGDAMLILP